MGEEKPGPMEIFQSGFNSFGRDSIGAEPAAGCPSRFGPRHCGQSAAWTGTNTKDQTPNTNQLPNLKSRPPAPWPDSSGLFGRWSLKVLWCLVFGAWCFVTVPPPVAE